MITIGEEKLHLALIAVVAIVAIAGLSVMYKSADVQTQPSVVIVPADSEISDLDGLESEDLVGDFRRSRWGNRTRG